MKKLILASKSPRRDEILTLVGLGHEIFVSDADETVPEGMSAADCAALNSARKAAAVIEKTSGDRVVLAADTVVEVGSETFGKPKDAEDAARMLLAMSGGHHLVHTGITVTDGRRTVTETVTTGVVMRRLSECEIDGYIESGEPFDKAGAYGIQGIAAAFVESLDGDYFNVMGLPICRVCEILGTFGIGLFDRK